LYTDRKSSRNIYEVGNKQYIALSLFSQRMSELKAEGSVGMESAWGSIARSRAGPQWKMRLV